MLSEKMDISYLRLSLEDDDVASGETRESCSIGSQRLCIKEYVRNHADVPTALTEFVDDGYSGTSMDRPAMTRIIQLVTMRKVRTIIVRDLSRFARNYLEAGHYLEYVFPSYDVRFISINDNYDSAKIKSGDPAALQLAIRNLLNDLYSKDISRKIKSAVDLKKLNGEYVYGQAPYGYKKGKLKNTIEVDEEAAIVVRRIFQLAKQGVTVTQIAQKMNEEKVLTPSVYLASVRGKYKTRDFWTFESVRNILINRIYTGDTVPFKSRVVRIGSNRVKMIPEEEQIVLPDTHEAIISRETYYQARSVIKTNKKTKTGAAPNVFSGYLVCGCCGNKLSKGRPTNKNWLCATARYTEETECKAIRLNEAMMKEKLLTAVQLQCNLADAKLKQTRHEQDKTQEEIDSLTWELKQKQRNLDENASRLMELLEDYYAGKHSKEVFLAKKEELKVKKDVLTESIRKIEEQISSLKAEKRNHLLVEDEVNKLNKHGQITELDTYLMKELVKEIRVYPGNAVQIIWNFADTITA
ncbi:MAG: recombinase family protein [Lachnospiraceae bacterium]|nr:recombinase family protein [Lachnospiraceae bacterium]MBQ6996610.1 recombinase family protein [Lachnospiraceae bacterium]